MPTLDTEFSGDHVLAMSFVPGTSIESLIDAPQDERDRVMHALIELVLRELFEFGLMQTDPNFANFRYQPETGHGAATATAGSTIAVTVRNDSGFSASSRCSGSGIASLNSRS